MKLVWNPQDTPAELHPALLALGEEYPLSRGTELENLHFRKSNDEETLRIEKKDGSFTVHYGRISSALRGTAYALAGMECAENAYFRMFGVLLDCSRTGVITPAALKPRLRRLALLGCTTIMLYTKDAYQLPGETYFGYMRGAYSLEEIREMDAYAKSLGIEMIASIQALGHLEPVLRWSVYGKVCDTENVILADEPESYELLEKMLKFWSEALSTRRIHLGMDETHDLGRGRFMDINGYERPFDIYNRHLGRLCALCGKYELKPTIWSDMYFRYCNKNQDYYDTDSEVPEDVKSAIPKRVQLSYWDYYHRDKETYVKKLRQNRELNGNEPMMASGIWTWGVLWCDYEQTMATVAPCIDACRETSVREIIFTMWGDDGGYCEFDSAFAGFAWCADYAFHATVSTERISALFQAVCGTSYELQLRAEGAVRIPKKNGETGIGRLVKLSAPAMLWDDPLMGIVWHEYEAFGGANVWKEIVEKQKATLKELEPYRSDRKAGYIEFSWRFHDVLRKKIEFRLALLNAYKHRDSDELRRLADKGISEVRNAIDEFLKIFREQWFRSYKSYGLEIMQIRLGGLSERYRETARRIHELLDGKLERMEELDLNPDCNGLMEGRYRMIATGGWFI